VTERAIAGQAPYHHNKNSVGDAILIEAYAGLVASRSGKKTRFAFVTHNSRDFSEPNGDRRKPHPDIAGLFTAPKSTYWGSLPEF
jgi:PIN domain-containing protein